MRTILVPTDFSKNAYHAAAYAVQMAQVLGHKVLLVHAYEAPVAISEYELNTIHFNTMEEHILKRLENEKETLQNKYGNGVIIETAMFNNNLISHLADLYSHPDAFLAVIGLTGSGMANFFLGGNTLNIVNKLGRAVLTIPPFTAFRPIKKLVFAFDLWNVAETLPVKRLKRVQELLNAELLILNVVRKNQESQEDWTQEKARLDDMMNGLAYSFHTVSGTGVVNGINDFAKNQQADMLAIVPNEKGFIENLLGENHTKALLFRSGIPILTLPPDEQ